MSQAFVASSRTRRYLLTGGLFAVVFIGLVLALQNVYPVGVDWQETYTHAAANWRDPYGVTLFTNPPWALLLLPHAFLPLRLGNAINLVLNIVMLMAVIRHFGGNWFTMLMVFTSFFFFDLARTNNIDWIPMLGLLLPAQWGILLIAVKPHLFGGVVLIWWKERKFNLWIFIPTLIAFVLSLVLYGMWITRSAGLPEDSGAWNIAPFPFGIPIGVALLYYAWRRNEVILAAIATGFLTPYIAPYSVTTLFAIGGSKYKREAAIVWVATLVYVIYEARRVALFTG